MDSQIDRAMRRTWRYWYEDGLAEMALGAMFAALGLVFLAETLLPPGPFQALLGMFGPLVAMLGVGWLSGRAVKAAKARITYPRTGYVAYRRQKRGLNLVKRFALGAAIGALVGALAALPALHSWTPAVMGLIMGAIAIYGGYRLDLARFYALGAVSIAIGVATSLASLGEISGGGAYFIGTGLALVLSGVLGLWTYLRVTQPPAEAKDYGQRSA